MAVTCGWYMGVGPTRAGHHRLSLGCARPAVEGGPISSAELRATEDVGPARPSADRNAPRLAFGQDSESRQASAQKCMYCDTLTATLIDSTRRLYTLVGFPIQEALRVRIEEFDRFRAEATPFLTA